MNRAAWIVPLVCFAACETAPYTGRKQFILLSPSQELSLGSQAYQETLGKSRVVGAGPQMESVRGVGARIAPVADEDLKAAGLPPFQWEFNVIEEQTVNAWCLPGGKVAFFTGILPICQDEDGIATVMGHEIGHAIARHGAERITTGLGIEIVAQALETGLSKSKPATREAVIGAFGLGSQLGVALPFDRNQELEADHIGLMLMAKAGYDPRKASQFWERMAAQSQGAPPEFLSTHPSDENRIAQIRELLPKALAVYSPRTQEKP